MKPSGFDIIELLETTILPEALAMNKSIAQATQNDKQISKSIKRFFIIPEISLCDISGITTKAPCEVALMSERHMRYVP